MQENYTTDRHDIPIALTPKFEGIPPLLTQIPNRWVLWRHEYRGGKWAKVPKQPHRINASPTNPATWHDFHAVKAAYESHSNYFSGIGFILGQPLLVDGRQLYVIGIDFDDCVEGNKPTPWAQQACKELNTYTEYSPSGQGLRIFVLHDKPVPVRKTNIEGSSREIYSERRYVTVTGWGNGKEVRHV